MTENMTNAALRDIGTLFSFGTIGELSDGQLIERFLSGPRDEAEAAFADRLMSTVAWGDVVMGVQKIAVASVVLKPRTMPTTPSRRRSWCWSGGRTRSPGGTCWQTGSMGSLIGQREWHGPVRA